MVTAALANAAIRVYRFKKARYPRILIAGPCPDSKAGAGGGQNTHAPARAGVASVLR
jgi:hypothetical protein